MFVYALLEWKILQLANSQSPWIGQGTQTITGIANPVSAVGTVSLSSIGKTINSSSNIGGLGLFSADRDTHEYLKVYEVVESTEDILTLSCTWHRLRNRNCDKQSPPTMTQITSVTDRVLYSLIEPEDREFASKIRDYYSKKLMVQTLREQPMSNFRKDMSELVNGNGLRFKKDMQPLAYRLPEFYFYDQQMDEMFRPLKKEIVDKNELFVSRRGTEKLTPLRSSSISPKNKQAQTEYWFKDKNDYVYRVKVLNNNSLRPMWESIFSLGKELTISGSTRVTPRDSVQFYDIYDWKVDMKSVL